MVLSRREGALGVAIVLHVGMVALLPLARRNVPRPTTAPGETWIDLEATTTPSGGGNELGAIANARIGARRTIHERATTTTNTNTGNGATTETSSEGTTSTETQSASTESEKATLFLGRDAIGLSGPGSYRIDLARQQAPENERLAEDVNHAIMDPIRAHETANGGMTSGPLAQELEKTTRHLEGTPFEGRAVFSVRVDELGLVVSVGVDDATGDRRAWEEVASHVLNALAQRRLRVPPNAKGVAMRIEISSRVQMPSGGRVPLTVTSPAGTALAHALQGQFDRPPESPGIVGGSFDLSDIGAHPLRVVGARVLSENVY